MATYESLRQAIDTLIKTNGNEEITGAILNNVLNAMITALGANYQFCGEATPSTNPGQPLQNVFYFAYDAGTYVNFGNITLPMGISTLSWDGTSWTGETIYTFDQTPLLNSNNLISSGAVYNALVGIYNAIGNGKLYEGIATPSTVPTPLEGIRKFYIATQAGTYTNFLANGDIALVLPHDGLYVIYSTTGEDDDDWNYEEIFGIDGTPLLNSTNLITSGAVYNAISGVYTSIGIGKVFAGIAVPSTTPEPINGVRMFYIAIQAGTYSHFFANYDIPLVLPHDGLYVIYSTTEDDDWNWEEIVGFDDVPTSGSDNLVRSGGVFNELALGAVYDVSAKNPTAGPNNDGKFTSLSALLNDANLNTLIPVAFRKGGMSIKFVQSSDNIYVQYRLMTTSFSTISSDWQGVDYEPIPNSPNIVTSGAVADVNGYRVEDEDWSYVLTDKYKRIIAGIKPDGSVEWKKGIPSPIQKKINEILSSIDILNDSKVNTEEGKALISSEYSDSINYVEDDSYDYVITDKKGRIIFAIRNDGDVIFGYGIPTQIIDYIRSVLTSSIKNIQEEISYLENVPKRLQIVTDGNFYTHDFNILGGHIYKISIDEAEWPVSDIPSDNVVLAFTASGNYLLRVTREQRQLNPLNCYYFKAPIGETSYTGRFYLKGNSGYNVSVTLTDVTDTYTNVLYDVAFESENNAYKSYTVKLPRFSLIRYIAGSDGVNPTVKVFSRNTEDITYLTDSLINETVGVVMGDYFMKEEGFVTVFSTTSSPSFKVITYQEVPDKVFPHQLYFDTDNIITLLSTNDQDVSEYDNKSLNSGSIIAVNESLYCMLYYARGIDHLPNILMAYSTDLIHWTRGIPSGIEAPYPGTNIIFKDGVIVGEFEHELVNEFCVTTVDDKDNKYRLFANIVKIIDGSTTIKGECSYLLKSNDLVHWTPIKKVLRKSHDNFPSAISYGDKIHIYNRMWDYTQPDDSKKRLIGDLWIDIWGNVIVPPSALFGHGLYNAAAGRIGSDRDIFLPTNYYYTNVQQNIGDGVYEAYIRENDIIFAAPTYNISKLIKNTDNGGFGYVCPTPIVANGRDYYAFYLQSNKKHGQPSESGYVGELRLCPIKWVTYGSHNIDGDN